MTIKPLADNVVIKATEAEETTKSGIVDGKEVGMTLKKGQKVIAANYAGTDIKIDNEEYTILRQSDILAIVE